MYFFKLTITLGTFVSLLWESCSPDHMVSLSVEGVLASGLETESREDAAADGSPGHLAKGCGGGTEKQGNKWAPDVDEPPIDHLFMFNVINLNIYFLTVEQLFVTHWFKDGKSRFVWTCVYLFITQAQSSFIGFLSEMDVCRFTGAKSTD